MRTLRYLSCPTCDYSMSVDALSRRMVGRFRVDVRLCQGRKGLPHVAYDEMTVPEKDIVKQRLLMALKAALDEGVIVPEDLDFGMPGIESAKEQIPMPMTMSGPEALNSR